ncbi:MAG: DUF134 domain-containing protein [Epsilonproteobacteria bacterium]|nr:DUF134 domain-containing protein [Campylobacterota bacterium]
MGRDKLKRKLSFKPVCKEFKPSECANTNTIRLLHEELEALYLMDIKELYQADAAKKMGVSRPTFARILKNARNKVAMTLITGANLVIEDEKEDFSVMIPSDLEEELKISSPSAKYLHIYEVKNREIVEKKVIKNPVFSQDVRPGQVIPEICNKENVNFFVSDQIGSGLKNALLSIGVHSYPKKEISLEEIKEFI